MTCLPMNDINAPLRDGLDSFQKRVNKSEDESNSIKCAYAKTLFAATLDRRKTIKSAISLSRKTRAQRCMKSVRPPASSFAEKTGHLYHTGWPRTLFAEPIRKRTCVISAGTSYAIRSHPISPLRGCQCESSKNCLVTRRSR